MRIPRTNIGPCTSCLKQLQAARVLEGANMRIIAAVLVFVCMFSAAAADDAKQAEHKIWNC